MGDRDELALVHEAVQDFDEAGDVRLIERGVHFVEHAEWAGLDHVDGKKERNGRHGALAAREEADALELLTGRLGDDLDAALKRVGVVHEHEVRAAAAEKLGEHDLEVLADFFEGLGEEGFRGVVDLRDDFEQLGLR